MDKVLPEQLQVTLDSLLCNGILCSWTIHGNSGMSTVIMRFKMDGCTEDTMKEAPTGSAKYKRVPPSQLKRDMVRASEWKESADREMDDVVKDNDGASDKSVDIVQCVKPKQKTVPGHATPNIASVSLTTRSRSRAAFTTAQQTSPLPQTDGAYDSDHMGDSISTTTSTQSEEFRTTLYELKRECDRIFSTGIFAEPATSGHGDG